MRRTEPAPGYGKCGGGRRSAPWPSVAPNPEDPDPNRPGHEHDSSDLNERSGPALGTRRTQLPAEGQPDTPPSLGVAIVTATGMGTCTPLLWEGHRPAKVELVYLDPFLPE